MLQHRSSEALFALHDQDGLLDLLPLRAQFRKHLADVHNSITSVSRRYRCGEVLTPFVDLQAAGRPRADCPPSGRTIHAGGTCRDRRLARRRGRSGG